MSVSIPNIDSIYVKGITKVIGVKSKPFLIDFIPEKDAKVLDCFPTVQKKVKECGGNMILGWQFWETTNIIEAEFHAVWESPEEKIIDITPKSINGIYHTLFLIDENLVYQGKQKDNYRINTTQNKFVDDLIKVCEAIFKFENKGERAYQYSLQMTALEEEKYHKLKSLQELYQIIIDQKLGKNSPCVCGSGEKIKHCHGKNLQQTLSQLI